MTFLLKPPMIEEIPAVLESESEGEEGDEKYEQLPRKQLFETLDECCDKTNYQHLEVQDEENKSYTYMAKYGLLYRILCDAEVPYTYSTLPYVRKPEVIGANDYYVTGCDEYTKWLVNKF